MQMASSSGATSGWTVRGLGTAPLTIFWSTATSGTPLKSRFPASISQRIIPMEKRSARRSTFSPIACSGAM